MTRVAASRAACFASRARVSGEMWRWSCPEDSRSSPDSGMTRRHAKVVSPAVPQTRIAACSSSSGSRCARRAEYWASVRRSSACIVEPPCDEADIGDQAVVRGAPRRYVPGKPESRDAHDGNRLRSRVRGQRPVRQTQVGVDPKAVPVAPRGTRQERRTAPWWCPLTIRMAAACRAE